MKTIILTMNVGNPSLERAKRQCEWIDQQSFDILVLTETKNSQGCQYIYDHFFDNGFDFKTINTGVKFYVSYPRSKTGDLGVMIISKREICSEYNIFESNNRLYSRFSQVSVGSGIDNLNIIGLYVPSRDRSIEKINRKTEFINWVSSELNRHPAKKTIIAGDFNILDRNHIPHYPTFYTWEYEFYDHIINNGYCDVFCKSNPGKQDHSWVGRTSDGYRYDYIFASSDLVKNIGQCYFIHETRHRKLTDHSALYAELDI